MNSPPAVEPERLGAFFPAEINPWVRAPNGSVVQERVALSLAETSYTGGETAIAVRITDMGGYGSIEAMGLGWPGTLIERSSGEGFERTVAYRSYPAYERYVEEGREGEVQVLVAGRFLVRAAGTNAPVELIREVLDGLDLGALEAMRDEGR